MRDDFPKAVLETLAKRVGYRCSNPSCRKLTSGPHTDEAKVVNVGVAGHITAASPGGPRYDPTLTPKERRSADNGVWLCQTCGKLVDNDEARFPVELLREWRQQAEEAARQEVESAQSRPATHEEHFIQFGVDDWKTWRERGNLPGDGVWFLTGWRRGDVRYSCTIRLRNNLEWEEQLHRFRAEFRKGDQSLFTDSILDDKPVVLPPKKWVSLDVYEGLRDRSIVEAADSVWLMAEAVGDNVRFEWLLTRLAVTVDELEEW